MGKACKGILFRCSATEHPFISLLQVILSIKILALETSLFSASHNEKLKYYSLYFSFTFDVTPTLCTFVTSFNRRLPALNSI